MLAPADQAPPEVEAAIDREQRGIARQHARAGLYSYSAFLGMLAFMLWIGVRSWTYVAIYLASLVLVVGIAASGLWATSIAQLRRGAFVVVLFNALFVAVLAHGTAPLLMAPAVAAITAMLMLQGPQFRSRVMLGIIVVAMVGSVLVPWAMEAAGWLAPTMRGTADHLEMTTSVLEPRYDRIKIGLATFVIGSVAAAALMSVGLARSRDDAQRRLHLHLWRARQLAGE
jgi:hypothetical protein